MLRFMSKHKLLSSVVLVILIIFVYVLYNGSYSYPIYDEGQIYIVERVLWDTNRGQIIGNPDFKPSFDNVDKGDFIEKFKKTQDALGYGFKVSEPAKDEDGFYDFIISFNDKITLKYSDGFIKMAVEDYDANKVCFYQALRTVYFTLSPEEEMESFPAAKDVENFQAYGDYFMPFRVDYRFYNDEVYEVHIEDMKMGH